MSLGCASKCIFTRLFIGGFSAELEDGDCAGEQESYACYTYCCVSLLAYTDDVLHLMRPSCAIMPVSVLNYSRRSQSSNQQYTSWLVEDDADRLCCSWNLHEQTSSSSFQGKGEGTDHIKRWATTE